MCFLTTLLERINSCRLILYFDEMTSNLWDSLGKMWVPESSKVVRRLPRQRGKNVTLMGCLTNTGMVFCQVVNKTNKEIVEGYFRDLSREVDLKDACIVLDNHAAHWSK